MRKKITFFPIGNADSSLIELSNDKVVLIDFADMKNKSDLFDKRCDLSKELNDRVKKDSFDVVCFTHLDDDHIRRSTEYFFLDFTKKYQEGDRKKINELWVPAAALIECKPEGEASTLQREIRYRFRNKYGIKIFSKPKKLKDWCEKNGYDFESRRHLIVDAGKTVTTFDLDNDGVEFFVHSPFVATIDGKKLDRNCSAILLHATFDNSYSSKVMFGSDINWETWEEVVKVTEHFGRAERLEWDIFHISHHCSYLSLSDEKGNTKTLPKDNIKKLFEEYRNTRGYIISPSKVIPSLYETIQPPHKQASNYYLKDVVNNVEEYFQVTMSHPTNKRPKPMTFEISNYGVKLLGTATLSTTIGSVQPPRAG